MSWFIEGPRKKSVTTLNAKVKNVNFGLRGPVVSAQAVKVKASKSKARSYQGSFALAV